MSPRPRRARPVPDFNSIRARLRAGWCASTRVPVRGEGLTATYEALDLRT